MWSHALKRYTIFKPFDVSTAHRCNQEHVLYVQVVISIWWSKFIKNNKDKDRDGMI